MTDEGQHCIITLALCTHNHADRLPCTLEALHLLKIPSNSWEIVVVDNASSDETPQLLTKTDWHPKDVSVRIVREEKLGLSHARNCAIREARGDYIVFIDDDETPDPSWLSAYERAINAYAPDALGGRIEVMFEHGERVAWLQDELLGFLGRLNHGEGRWLSEPATPIYGGNFAFRRSVFSEIGGFDTELGRKGTANIGGEDTEIYRRLLKGGYKVRWVPEAVIYHRIQVDKLKRGYFLGLHYRQGWMEGARKREKAVRLPPIYLLSQLMRAVKRALAQRLRQGKDFSLRLEMNAVYFLGFLLGWMFAKELRN